MNGQWLKLFRKSTDSRVFSDAAMWHLWSWLLMKANWKLGYVQGFEIMPGSLATSYESIAIAMKCSRSTAERRIKKLVSWDMISLKPGRYFTIISICNWKTYQDYGQDDREASGKLAGNQRESSGNLAGTIEEYKEEKEREEGEERGFSRTEFPKEFDQEARHNIAHASQIFVNNSTRRNRFGYPDETVDQVTPIISELVRTGIPIEFITEHIQSKSWNRNTPRWDLDKYFRKAHQQANQPAHKSESWDEKKARFIAEEERRAQQKMEQSQNA